MNTEKQNSMKMEINHMNDNFTVMSMLAPKALNHIIKKIEKPEEVTGITTCFPSLDFYTSGLQRGNLIVVAGRPSMGKQCFVRNIAMHVALVNNLSVVLLDSEKSDEHQVMRMITSMAKMDYDLLLRGQISNDDTDLLKSSFAFLNDAPIYFPKLIPATVEELGVQLHKLDQKTGGLGLIVVDCLNRH
jgi:replicative DNA helicase